jgi:hypothetical protein
MWPSGIVTSWPVLPPLGPTSSYCPGRLTGWPGLEGLFAIVQFSVVAATLARDRPRSPLSLTAAKRGDFATVMEKNFCIAAYDIRMKWLAHPTDGADGGSELAKVPDLTTDQWTELVERLTLHASSKLRRLHWRGVSGSLGGKIPGGVEAADLAQWAILDVIEDKRAWDPEADPDFLKFLQGVVDSKVSHLVEGVENRKSRRLGRASAGDESSDAYEIEARGPSPADLVANRETAEKFRTAVIKCLEDDDLAYKVLECLESEYTSLDSHGRENQLTKPPGEIQI